MKTPVYLFAEPCYFCNGTGKILMKPMPTSTGIIESMWHWFFSCEPMPFDTPYEASCPICYGAKNIITIRDDKGNEVTGILQ